MFQINDIVIHKSAGACVVKNIVVENFGTGEKKYYLLAPKFPNKVNKLLEIYLPVEKENEQIRKPMPKSAILSLISTFSSLEVEWISDAKTRKQTFEKIYHSGDIRNFCKLVKLLYVEPTFLSKPMSLTDKNFLLKIKTLIFDEFAVALEIQPEEVDEYIKKFIS